MVVGHTVLHFDVPFGMQMQTGTSLTVSYRMQFCLEAINVAHGSIVHSERGLLSSLQSSVSIHFDIWLPLRQSFFPLIFGVYFLYFPLVIEEVLRVFFLFIFFGFVQPR